MNEYRFELPATVIFSVRADSLAEAEAFARSLAEKHVEGDDLDYWDEDSDDPRLYLADPLPEKFELVDVTDDVEEEE